MNKGLDVFNVDETKLRFTFDKAKERIQQRLDPSEIKERRDNSGNVFKYVEAPTVIRILNEAFNYQWSFEVVREEIVQSVPKWDKNKKQYIEQPPYVTVLGRLTVPGWGVREQYGSKTLIGGADNQESAKKAAASDALKKCASLFGIALELYEKEQPAEAPQYYAQSQQTQYQYQQPQYQNQQYHTNQQYQHQQNYSNQQAYTQPQQATSQQTYAQSQQVNYQQQNQSQASSTQQNGATDDSNQNGWRQESIDKLKRVMNGLGIDQNGLDPYVREYFNDANATKDYITPQNIDAIVQFLEGKLQAQTQSPHPAATEWV